MSVPSADHATDAARRAALARPSPQVEAGPIAHFLVSVFHVIYGRRTSFRKFRAQELVARTPYQAWERNAYAAVTRSHPRPPRPPAEEIATAREEHDNEQRHHFWISELCARHGEPEHWLRDRVIPRALAMVLGWVAWLAHMIAPRWAHHLNAQLEQRAERDYLRHVAEHPELERTPSPFPEATTVADLLRSIALDERAHKEDSLARSAAPAEARRDHHRAFPPTGSAAVHGRNGAVRIASDRR
jgi:ubiquinol oxidase